jgi:putative transposase
MPHKKKPPANAPAFDLPQDLLEKLIPGPMDAAGVEAVFQRLKKAVIERALGAELGLHLASSEGGCGNHRNGRSGKTVLTDEGALRIEVPRDRAGSFEPQLIPKHERRFPGFDDKIVSMYARGMTVREIQAHLAQMYSKRPPPTPCRTIAGVLSAPQVSTDAAADHRCRDPAWWVAASAHR